MVYKFNPDHYKNIFDGMFGKGQFNSGIKMASKVGRLKVQAQFAKSDMLKRLRAQQAAALKQQRALEKQQQKQQAEAKSYSRVKAIQSPKVQQSKMKNYLADHPAKAASGYTPSKVQNVQGSKMFGYLADHPQISKPKQADKKIGGILGAAQSAGHLWQSAAGRFIVPISKTMDDVLTGGINSKLMKENGTNKKGKITDPVVKAANKNRGTETKVLHGIGTVLGYVAPMDAGYGVAGKALSVSGKLLKGTKVAETAGKIAMKAPKLAKLGKIAVKGATGSALGQTGVEGLQEAFNPKANNLQGHLKNIGTAAAAGAALDPAIRGVFGAGATGLSKLRKLTKGKIITSKSISSTPRESVVNKLFGPQKFGIAAKTSAKKSDKILNTADQIVGSKIKYDEGIKSRIASTKSKAITNFVDDLNPIKQIFGEKTYNVAMDSRRANNLGNVILHKAFVTPEGKVIGKSFDDIVKQIPRGHYKNVRDYLVLKDAASRMDNGQKVYADSLGMTAEKARQEVARIEKIHPEYKQISEDWNTFHSNLKKYYGVNENLLTQEASKAMDQVRPNYVPMQRQFTASEKPKTGKLFGVKNGLEGQKAPIKKVNEYGSQRPIVDPFKTTIEKVGQYTNAAMRNRAMTNIVEQIQKDPQAYKDIAQIVSGKTQQTASKNPFDLFAEQNMKITNGDVAASLGNDFANLKTGSKAKLSDPNIVRAMVKGEPVHIQIHNPQLVKALSGLGPERSNVVMNIAQRFSNATKRGATGALAPVFAVKGATMDLSQSIIQSKHPLQQAAYTVYGIISGLADELKIPVLRNMAREFELKGGKFDFAIKGDKAIDKHLWNTIKDPILSPKGLAKGAIKTAAMPFKTVGKVGNIFENAPRMAAAKIKMRELGGQQNAENVRQAMSAGREATVNWSRRGTIGKDVEAFVPYNNAAIQGTYRIMKAFKEHRIQTVASIATFAVLPKLAEYAAFHNDPDYNKIPERIKYRNIIVGKNADGTFNMIPVEPGYNSFGQLTLDMLSNSNAKRNGSTEGALDAIANVWLPPISTGALQGYTQHSGLDGSIGGVLNATVAAPFAATYGNKAFYGGPIVPQRLQNNSPSQQFDEKTSALAKLIGQKTGMSPMKADYLIRSYGGDLSRLALPLTSPVGAGNPKTVLLRNFITDPVMTNNLANDFYAMKQRITQAKSDANTHGVKLPSWANSPVANAMTSQSKYGINKQVSDLLKQQRSISANKLMSAQLKEQRIRSIQAKINNIYLDGVTQMEKAGIPGRQKY